MFRRAFKEEVFFFLLHPPMIRHLLIGCVHSLETSSSCGEVQPIELQNESQQIGGKKRFFFYGNATTPHTTTNENHE